jgi:hypothetical protein
LLKWWTEQNPKRRHIWPGINTRKVGNAWPAEEIVGQINLTRKQAGSANGNIHWSIAPLRNNRGGMADALLKGPYADKSLVPACPWLSRNSPARPRVYAGGNLSEGLLTISWDSINREKPARWVVQTKYGTAWRCEIYGGNRTLAQYTGNPFPDAVAVYALDKYGNISAPAVLERK